MEGDRVVFRLFAAGQLAVWIAFAGISHGFQYGAAHESRPFAAFYGLLAAAFLLYFASLFRFWKCGENVIPWRAVFFWAVLFRLPLVFVSHPVQEIDYYRYLWDGRTLVAGVSPYDFAPAELDAMRASGQAVDGSAGKLIEILGRSNSWETIFSRIDHREVPTIYPVASQLVFAAAALPLPDSAPVFARLVVWRMVLGFFDLGVVCLLITALRRLGVPPVRAMLYAWCPLVLKEFANAAHMDAIAIFWVVAGLGWLSATRVKESPQPGWRVWLAWLAWMAGVLAKWYPLMLAPLLLSYGWARWRRRSLAPAGMAALLLATSVLLPTLRREAEAGKEVEGMRTFLERWEMNDLLFSLVRENLKLREEVTGGRLDPWYSVLPESWRECWHGSARDLLERAGLDPDTDIAFRSAQGLAALVLLATAWWLSSRPWPPGAESGGALARRAFWLLAASWYLSATQNPWYWCWALPFAVFVHPRALPVVASVSAFAMLYYLRFWLIYHDPDPAWSGLTGARWFDEVVVWFEHAPVLLALAFLAFRNFSRDRGNKSGAHVLPSS